MTDLDVHKEKFDDIPVLRPLLPTADKLLPYLRRIDQNRIYTNHGPLVLEFQNRLDRHFGLSPGCAVSASSGTTGLIAAILASAGRAGFDRPFALIPALTFVATAVAAEQCGYRVCLADVDSDSWTLDAEKVLGYPGLERVGVVIPVAPFGRPVPQTPWAAFSARTGIPVVIDGAASFEAISDQPEHFLGDVPVMISFHATKSFGTGEGGCIVTTDAALADRTIQALNYGFQFTRDSRSPSTNGKLSEYHAAVGLAELDEWDAKRSQVSKVVDEYRRQMSAAGIGDGFVAFPNISSTYALYRCGNAAESTRVQNVLLDHGVGSRLWYGEGLQRQTHFADSPCEELSVTESLAPCLIGLPTAPDMTAAAIARVVSGLFEGLSLNARDGALPPVSSLV